MTTLTLTAREFRSLVEPVLPLAGRDDGPPVLAAVMIEAEGRWLSATATDRYRAGIKRIEKRPTDEDESREWPEFSALMPVRVIKSLLTTFKARRGTLDPTLTLTVEDNKLTAEAVGLFDLFDAGRFVHTLQDGEYPKIRKVIKDVLETPEDKRATTVGLNPTFLADFKACTSSTLRLAMGAPNKAIVVTDDDGFIGLLMSRKIAVDSGDFGGPEQWGDFLDRKVTPVEPVAAEAVSA